MIIVDIETSGLDFEKCGIWQIGAIDLERGDVFFEEAKIDNEDNVESGALRVIGKTEEELRDSKKQSQKDLLANFLRWVGGVKIKNFICQNPQFDLAFILHKLKKYKIVEDEEKGVIPHRAYDLHSIASLKYFEVNGDFLIKDGKSDMGLRNILMFCGIEDKRKAHNALEDAKLTAECFSRIVYGKNMFEEYLDFEIPSELKN